MSMSNIFSWEKIGILLGLVFIAIYPIIHGDTYIMHIFILFFIWALVASNWNLLMGYAGIFSLGNIGYFAIGGYASGILAKTFGWSPWICIAITLLSGETSPPSTPDLRVRSSVWFRLSSADADIFNCTDPLPGVYLYRSFIYS